MLNTQQRGTRAQNPTTVHPVGRFSTIFLLSATLAGCYPWPGPISDGWVTKAEDVGDPSRCEATSTRAWTGDDTYAWGALVYWCCGEILADESCGGETIYASFLDDIDGPTAPGELREVSTVQSPSWVGWIEIHDWEQPYLTTLYGTHVDLDYTVDTFDGPREYALSLTMTMGADEECPNGLFKIWHEIEPDAASAPLQSGYLCCVTEDPCWP